MSTSYTTKTCIFFGCNEHLSHYNQLQYSRQPLAIGRFPIVGSCGSMVGLFYLHSLFLNALLPFLSQFIWITFLIQTFSSLPHTPISTTHFLYFFYHAFISLIALSSLSISLHSFLYWSLATTSLHSPFCIDLLLQCYDFFIFLKSNPVHSCSQ